MRPLLQEVQSAHTPESLARLFRAETGLVLLRSGGGDPVQARYSFVAVRPFLAFQSWATHIEIRSDTGTQVQFGDPWHVLDCLMQRYELLEQVDLPFPLGGCFGYWGYDLKGFVEPRLRRTAVQDLELPDCWIGFYDSLVVFDHALQKTWIVSTGLQADGSRSESRAKAQVEFWRRALLSEVPEDSNTDDASARVLPSNLSRSQFIEMVRRAKDYIQAGHIYQVNLAQRLAAVGELDSFELFSRLSAISPSPFSAYLNCGEFQLVSSSPERFLRLSGSSIQTRPIKGTRPRDSDPTRDAQLAYELQTSPKEIAELVMITDLLRNDLGRVCEYGSVQVPELVRLERFAQVQHLISTVTGELRPDVSHFRALAQCFPGGSVTGAPKIRAMEIIDEIEPVSRGPYTGCLGYLGFNRESQLSIIIRTAVCKPVASGIQAWFYAGAGIVADSDPAAEYEETWAKAAGFLAALASHPTRITSESRP
jgi:para-aminobenzoate synthetase component I